MKHQTGKFLKRPMYDPAARLATEKAISERFITGPELKARVRAALITAGYRNLADLARSIGVQNEWLYSIFTAKRPSLMAIQRLAVGLDVTMAYLTEKEF